MTLGHLVIVVKGEKECCYVLRLVRNMTLVQRM